MQGVRLKKNIHKIRNLSTTLWIYSYTKRLDVLEVLSRKIVILKNDAVR